jgi:hypothetical protein
MRLISGRLAATAPDEKKGTYLTEILELTSRHPLKEFPS